MCYATPPLRRNKEEEGAKERRKEITTSRKKNKIKFFFFLVVRSDLKNLNSRVQTHQRGWQVGNQQTELSWGTTPTEKNGREKKYNTTAKNHQPSSLFQYNAVSFSPIINTLLFGSHPLLL